MILLGMRTVST